MSTIIPTYKDVLNAEKIVNQFAHRTPVLTCKSINQICGCEIFFKCENFQKVGAFKFRGAVNSIFSLSEIDARNGVATHSSGNHAQAIALAAKMRGIPAIIVMPDNSPKVKSEAVAGYGAEIVFCKPTLEERESTLNQIVAERNCTFIHPYNNPMVIAGQATAAKELIEEIPDLNYIIAPVGGGGLMSGTLLSAKALSPNIKVIGAEPEGADDAYRSLLKGEIVPSINPNTIADGLLTSLGEITFDIIKNNIFQIVTASDEYAISAMKLIWERMKMIIEPSSAFPLAVLMQNKINLKNCRIGIIISGGNVDIAKVAEYWR